MASLSKWLNNTLLSTVLLLSPMFALVVPGNAFAATKEHEESTTAYAEMLANDSTMTSFALYDLNKDGIDELFAKSSQRPYYLVKTYAGGNVIDTDYAVYGQTVYNNGVVEDIYSRSGHPPNIDGTKIDHYFWTMGSDGKASLRFGYTEVQLAGKLIGYYAMDEDWDYTDSALSTVNLQSQLDSILTGASEVELSFLDNTAQNRAKLRDGELTDIGTVSTAKLFKRRRDNNSYEHSGASFFDTSTVCRFPTYQMSDAYYNKLVSGATVGEKAYIKTKMNEEWDGSCYGVALTMGLVFAGYLSPNNISGGNPSSYYAMKRPALNSKLLNSIQYYQLSHSLSKGGRDYATVAKCSRSNLVSNLKSWLGTGGEMHDFLSELVRQASVYGGDAVVLCYNHKDKDGKTVGHAVLATDCAYKNGKYDVQIYDENDRSAFKHMYISSDFSSFYYIDANAAYYRKKEGITDKSNTKYVLTQDSYVAMHLLDLSRVKGANDSTGLKTMSSSGSSNNVKFALKPGVAMRLVDGSGKVLSYDGSALSGNMPVYAADYTTEDTSTTLIVEASASGSITASNSAKSFSVCANNQDSMVSVSGSGIKSAVLKLGKGATIKGSKFTYETFVTTGTQVASKDPGLVSISGKASANVSISSKNGTVTAKSSKKMTKLESVSYVKSKAYSQSLSKSAKKVTRRASAKKTVISKGTKFSSSNLKFKITKATGSRTTQVIGLTAAGKKAPSIVVPSKVVYNGVTSKVTSVKASAFKNATRASSATIGRNVAKIGKSAFECCNKLTTITVASKKLTKRSTKGCLKGSKVKKIKVSIGKKSVNKKYVKKYKSVFVKKNAGKSARVSA